MSNFGEYLDEALQNIKIESDETAETNTCCKTCRFCYPVMKHPTYQETLAHVCLCVLVTYGDAYVTEVKGYDRCEYWMERRKGK